MKSGLMPDMPESGELQKFDMIFSNVEGSEPDSGRNLKILTFQKFGYLFSKQEFWVLWVIIIKKFHDREFLERKEFT